ncbi:MAG TPA: beta-propeller fold lactonase family protein [Gaiellaceae bacterium]|nr:beta-propeller fold lactonase family protein [Gaiellaceae bacterium]
MSSSRAALLVAAAIAVASCASASAAAHVRWASASPGVAQLPGADACYAQREEGAENAALCKVGKGLIDAAAAAVSPDGENLYVASWGSDAVGVFSRGASGGLTEFACISNNGTTGVDGTAGQCGDGDAMWGATALVVSPDGRNVYVASYASSGIAEFARDPASGRLRQFGCVRPIPTCTGARGLGGASSIAITPDGLNVYVAASAADSVTSFTRDPATGELKGIGCISDDGTDRMCAKGNALRGASAVTVSPDGKFVYVAAADSSSVLTFARDPSTGQLRQAGCVLDAAPKPGSCSRAYGLGTPTGLALSPDGSALFVSSYDSNAVVVFARNRTTGLLTERGCVSEPYEDDEKDGCTHVAPLYGPTGIAVSPDGLQLYVTGEVGLTVFNRSRSTGGLALAGCVTYAQNEDDQARKACQLGRGVAGATGVAVAPDGRNLYVTASQSNSVASFGAGVSTAVRAELGRRRLTVRVACPSGHASPCEGRISVVSHPTVQRPYAVDAGRAQELSLRLPHSLVRSLTRRAAPLLVAASDPGRLPVVRELVVGRERARHALHSRATSDDASVAAWAHFRQTFCARGSTASWCLYLTSLRVDRTTLTGVTSLTTARQANGAAHRICVVLSTFAAAGNPRARITAVRVVGRIGTTLARRRSLAARCVA